MKDLPFLVSFIFCYGLLSQSFLETRARHAAVSPVDIAECMERANVTSAELKRIQQLPEHRIAVINEDEELRKYGCFLACAYKKKDWIRGSALNSQRIGEFIGLNHNGDLDAMSFISKTVELCASFIEETDDECEFALAFRICILKAMRSRG